MITGLSLQCKQIGKRANKINDDKRQQKHRTGTVSNKILGGLNWYYTRATLDLDAAAVHKQISYSVHFECFELINALKQKT